MGNMIQFRVDEETKSLAKKAVMKRGLTISQICRELVTSLANTERELADKEMFIDTEWLLSQVQESHKNLESKRKEALPREEALSFLEIKKAKILENRNTSTFVKI